jgi:hypothetical protein
MTIPAIFQGFARGADKVYDLTSVIFMNWPPSTVDEMGKRIERNIPPLGGRD